MAKTVALVSNTAWNVVNFRSGFLRALVQRGYRVLVISPEDESVGRLGVEHIPVKIDRKGANPLADLKLFAHLCRIYRKERIDLVFHYTIKPVIYGSFAAHCAGIPSIATITGLGAAFIRKNWVSQIVALLYRLSMKKADFVFFQNGDDRRLFEENGWVRATATGLVPGSGVDTEYYVSRQPVSTAEDGSVTFLMIARLLLDKGVREYYQAARLIQKSYPQTKFRIVGMIDQGNPAALSRRELDGWVSEGVVEYMGQVGDVRGMIDDADCVVLPSYREGTPRALLEGASMKRPQVTTDVPGCREVVTDGVNGFLCKSRDYKGLAEAMRKILLMPLDERRVMGERGREIMIQRFSEELVIEKYLRQVERKLGREKL